MATTKGPTTLLEGPERAAAPGRPARKRPSQSIASIAPPPRQTFGEVAYANLRESILTTRLKPGTPISENELSAATGVSRTPIREAIRRLSEERLVEVSPHTGTIVSRIDADRARQAVFIRQSIECAVLRHKGRLADADLDMLEAQVQEHMTALGTGSGLGATTFDDDFHAKLMAACGYAEAAVATRAISGDITRILFLSGADGDYFASVARDHLDLVTRMRRGDYDAALDLLSRHLNGFVVDQERIKNQAADYFVAT